MTKLLPILLCSILLPGELEVEGDLKVTGTIQNDSLAQVINLQQQEINSLLALIAQLQEQIALLEAQMAFLGEDMGNADCFGVVGGGAVIDGCGVCDGYNESMDVCGFCGGDITDEVDCPNYVLSFDGTHDYVQLNNITYMGDFTISGIFSYLNGNGRLIDHDGGNNEDLIHIKINPEGELRAEIRNINEGQTLKSINVVDDGLYHSFAFIRNEDSLFLYLDEVREDAKKKDSFVVNNTIPTCFGCTLYEGTPHGYFSGTIDKVKIINSAVFPENSSYYISNDIQDDIIGLWNFNEGSGNILNDLSGNENHGTIHGATWVQINP